MGLAGRFEDVERDGSRSNSFGDRTEGDLRSGVTKGKGVQASKDLGGNSARLTCKLSPGQANGRGGAVAVREGAGLYLRMGGACSPRGGVFLYIQQAASQWAGPGRAAEAGGALPRPRNGNLGEPSRLAGVHPAPSLGLWAPLASDRAAAATTTAAPTAFGDPGLAGAAGGGGARALDVPERGGQREKGGRVGLG